MPFFFQDSGESCSLELPYKIKASDSSGKKSPTVSTLIYGSGFLDISPPSTISNSKHNTQLAVAYARWLVAHGCAGLIFKSSSQANVLGKCASSSTAQILTFFFVCCSYCIFWVVVVFVAWGDPSGDSFLLSLFSLERSSACMWSNPQYCYFAK